MRLDAVSSACGLVLLCAALQFAAARPVVPSKPPPILHAYENDVGETSTSVPLANATVRSLLAKPEKERNRSQDASARQPQANITIQNTYNIFLVVAPESGTLSLSSLANVSLRLSDVAGSVTSDGAGGLLRFARLISGLMDPAKAEKWLRSRGPRGSDKPGESSSGEKKAESESSSDESESESSSDESESESSSDESESDSSSDESESDSSSDESESDSSSDESESDSSSDESESDSSSDESESESSSDESKESEESKGEESQELSGESAKSTTTSPATSMDTTESGTGGSSELVELRTEPEELPEAAESTGSRLVFESREETETATPPATGASGSSGLRFDQPPHVSRERERLHRLLWSERGDAESETEQSGPSEDDPAFGHEASAGAEGRAEDVDSDAYLLN